MNNCKFNKVLSSLAVLGFIVTTQISSAGPTCSMTGAVGKPKCIKPEITPKKSPMIHIESGGFGTDGATGESIPLKSSKKDAARLYDAFEGLKEVKGFRRLDIKGVSSKELGEKGDNLRVGIQCEKTSDDEGNCLFTNLAVKQGTQEFMKRKGWVTLAPKISVALMEQLRKTVEVDTSDKPVGALVLKVGRAVECSKATAPKAVPVCKINVSYASISVDSEDVPEEVRDLAKSHADKLGL